MDRFMIDTWEEQVPKITNLDQIHHIQNVLRYKLGQRVELFDFTQKEYVAIIDKINENEIQFKILEETFKKRELPKRLKLYQGMCKGQKMDFIIQKSTELGVSEIHPCLFHRCMHGADNNSIHKIQRWEKIAIESSKQSKRVVVPMIGGFLSGHQIWDSMTSNHINFLFYEGDSSISPKTLLRSLEWSEFENVGVIIGPEGGFEEYEIEEFQKQKLGPVLSLGSRILRTETASIVASSLIAYEMSE